MTAPDLPLAHRTLGRVLADRAHRAPERVFLHWQDERLTYGRIEALTNRYAHGWRALGIGHGDHVAVMLPNDPTFLAAVWGLGKIGAVAVPLNTAARGEMLRYFIDQSDSVAVVVDDAWADRVVAISAELPKVRHYLHRAAPGASPMRPLPTGAAAAPRVWPLQVLEVDDERAPDPSRVRAQDTHLILYTSGTTGPSKGVMCPHSQGVNVGRQVAIDYGYRDDDVLYTCLPLFHANALWYSVGAALWAGASVALAPRFSANHFWDDIRRSGATQFNSLGAMTNILLQLPPGPHEREHRLRQCMVVPMQKTVYTQIRERYRVKVTSLFAMTENFAVTSFLPDDRPEKAGTAGSARGIAELRIVDDEDRPLAAGGVGEIQLRPREPGTMMSGYHAMPEQTAQAFVDGWFRTGDRGWLDSDGYLTFVDRKKEAIRRRGENISAYEVEMILSRHPAIHEVAAIPVPSELSEDEVMVYVVRKPGASLTEAEVVHHAINQMSYFMVPRFVRFVDALPKTATEKIEKYKLKQQALEQRDTLWDREREGIVVRR